jgi:hypothetical protein
MIDSIRHYSRDEQRVCDYIQKITKEQIGCGDDPIGFLIASHAYLAAQCQDNVPLTPEQCVKAKDPHIKRDFNL